jgi:tyrosyl-tRNA synthetase
MKVIIDENKIERLLTRGVEDVFVKESLKSKLFSGKRLKVYLGIDPTGPTLHMGHAIPILKLKEFQDLGHQVILLMGDFTAMIGDPTDKGTARKPLSRKEVLLNLKKYKKQASKFLKFTGKNPAQFKFNSKWLSKMNFEQVLDLASKTTIDQMLKRDMFAKRREEGKPIFGHEFFYPLMQGYDSVALDVDVEVGGNDQTFNMLVGRDLVGEILKKDKSVISMKLLEDNNGKKMGKTEGNMVSFEDSPEDMFGKVMSWNDSLIEIGFELCTSFNENEILKTDNPKDSKMQLAFEIVKIYHGDKKAQMAKEDWVSKFEKKEIPDELIQIKEKGLLLDILVTSKLILSKNQARRLFEEGAVLDLVSKEKIKDIKYQVKKGDKLKIGKKLFIEII